jgi:hypothetical protein
MLHCCNQKSLLISFLNPLSLVFTFSLILIFLLLFGSWDGVLAKTYKGAELRTNEIFLYGRFEVRMKSAAGSGLLSSFFTYYDPVVYPAPWNEIDIEILGRYANRIQYNIITPGQINHVIDTTLAYIPHVAFHVYAFEWTPDYVAWLVDGFELYRETSSHVQELTYEQKTMMNIWPPDNPDWAGSLNPLILPIFAYYDWVKYYEYAPGWGDNFSLQWNDDFDSWNQVRWGKGTHTWQGNLCDFIPENAVFQDGYLILCLTNETNIGYSGAPIIDEDSEPPYLVWARNYPGFVKVFFSEALDPITAQDPANYNIPPLTVNQAQLLSDNRTVNLRVSNLDPNQSYNLIVNGVKDLAATPNTINNKVILTKTTPQLPIHINVGGNLWQNYLADQIWTEAKEYGYVGGTAVQLPDTLEILNTQEDTVFHSELRDLTFYEVRLPEGRYDITLQFAETEYSSPSSRQFDVMAENQVVINALNIFVEAGLQMNTAVERVISDFEVTDGVLNLYFAAVNGEPVLSGIKVELLTTGIREKSLLPTNFSWNLFPNPFNSRFTLEYQLQQLQDVEIQLYTIQGQLVRTLFRNKQTAGVYTQRFQLPNLSTGIYLIALKVDRKLVGVKKAVYLK